MRCIFILIFFILNIGCNIVAKYPSNPGETNICLDPSFLANEDNDIRLAFQEWQEYTKIKYNYRYDFNQCDLTIFRFPEVRIDKSEINNRTIAFCNKLCGNHMIILIDRIGIELKSVIMHEYGHILGLRHSDDPNDLMYFQIQKEKKHVTKNNYNKIGCH